MKPENKSVRQIEDVRCEKRLRVVHVAVRTPRRF